jgi:membrane associated rhomboid family serine protease
MLLIGPILEEKYGSKQMFYMIVLTALFGGLLNAIFFDTGLIGASGVVFMMIVLASFVNVQRGTLPLTFLLVLVLYIGQEVVQAFSNDSISQFAHIMGGGAGALFGFMVPPKGTKESTASSSLL